jgi:hypothetical protein
VSGDRPAVGAVRRESGQHRQCEHTRWGGCWRRAVIAVDDRGLCTEHAAQAWLNAAGQP